MSLLEALGYVGDTLAKPGRAVRGLLAGRPDELANLIPFSDTMGITDPTKQVHGRDLLNQWGMAREGDTDFGTSLGGFAVDVATDPLTFLGGAMLGGAGKLLGKTNPSKMGAVAGSDAAHGLFPLTDPIERLIPESEHALRTAKGATSEWAPLADDLRPIPGQPEFPPKMTPLGDEIPPHVPGPITEPFSPDRAGYMLAYGPGYREIGKKYGLAGPWESSIPLEMAQDGYKEMAMRTHMDEWSKILDDFDRMTPEARAQMGFPNTANEFELSLQDEIAQLSPHAAPWQQLLGLRHAELWPMRELAVRNALPSHFADDLGRQHERIQPLLDRWSDGSPLANTLTRLLDEGTIPPSQVSDLIHGFPPAAGDAAFVPTSSEWSKGVLGHLPVDEESLRQIAFARNQEAALGDITAELNRLYGNMEVPPGTALPPGFDAYALEHELRSTLGPDAWVPHGYDPEVVNHLLSNPAAAGEYADDIATAQEWMRQLAPSAQAYRDAQPRLQEMLARIHAGNQGNGGGAVPVHEVMRNLGHPHVDDLAEALGLANPNDLRYLASGGGTSRGGSLTGLPQEDRQMVQFLLTHLRRPVSRAVGNVPEF